MKSRSFRAKSSPASFRIIVIVVGKPVPRFLARYRSQPAEPSERAADASIQDGWRASGFRLNRNYGHSVPLVGTALRPYAAGRRLARSLRPCPQAGRHLRGAPDQEERASEIQKRQAVGPRRTRTEPRTGRRRPHRCAVRKGVRLHCQTKRKKDSLSQCLSLRPLSI